MPPENIHHTIQCNRYNASSEYGVDVVPGGYMLGVPTQETALILCHLLLLLQAGNTDMTRH